MSVVPKTMGTGDTVRESLDMEGRTKTEPLVCASTESSNRTGRPNNRVM